MYVYTHTEKERGRKGGRDEEGGREKESLKLPSKAAYDDKAGRPEFILCRCYIMRACL